MDLIYGFLIIIIVCFIAVVINSFSYKEPEQIENPRFKEKFCPPHRWEWEEQPGFDKPVYFIRCQRCRRLPGWDREEK